MKILIAGDSWGCGVWPGLKKKNRSIPKIFKSSIYHHSALIHQGVEFFLSTRGYEVVNRSVPGGSNSDIIRVLSKSSFDDFDFIFVFFTNPIRDLYKGFSGVNVNFNLNEKLLKDDGILYPFIKAEPKSLTFDDFISINDILALEYKKKLENLSYRNPIYLIGGHSKIPKFFNESDKTKILIPSLREYFYENFTQSEIMYEATLPELLLKKFNIESLEMFQIYSDNFNNLPNIQKEFFWPDGHHLNIAGHKVLADYIHDFIVASRNLDNKHM